MIEGGGSRLRGRQNSLAYFPSASEALASALVDGFIGGHLGGQAFNESAGRVL